MFTRAQQLEVEEEFYARQDAIRERYACQIEDARRESLMWEEEQEYMTKVWESGYGTDFEAYEARWDRIIKYAESGAGD